MKVGEIYSSNNCGDVEVIEYVNALKVKVRFLNTETDAWFEAGSIRKGEIKDYNQPSVCGVGYIGYGSHMVSIKGMVSQSYSTWSGILKRCYKPTHEHFKNYGAKGVTVCKEWHNFQNFAKWYEDNYPNDGRKYHIDKDLLSNECKVYSPETCCLLTQEVNNTLAHAKHYKMVSPEGEAVEIYNMAEFCRENNLCQSNMIAVHNGKGRSYKGWTKAK